MTSLAALLDAACAASPDAVALTAPGPLIAPGDDRARGTRGHDWTYAALSRAADGVADSLRAGGLRPHEPVHALVSNHPFDIVALLGIWRAGGVAVPTHRANPEIVNRGYYRATGARFAIERDAGDGARVEIIARHAPPERPLLTDAALIVFTSGSTGEPKGVVLSHQAFAGKLHANDSFLHFGAGERTLLVLNITFSFGIWVSLLTLMRGGTLVMEERFDASRFAGLLEEHAIDRVAVVPTMMRAWLPRGERVSARCRLAQMMIGGEFLPAALGEAIVSAFPRAALVDIYGLTETSTSDFILMPEERALFGGCIGRAAPGVAFRIADGDGKTLPAGEAGELQLRTPYLMNGYLDRPDLTAAAMANGWFRTGDMGRTREGGIVELVGRAKELIIRGAAKISPLEIEQVLAQHPDVAGALVAGVPDPVVGERINAFVVPRPGTQPTGEALRAFARERLERFKVPDVIHFGTELPLGRTGKADRGELRRRVESTMTPPPAVGS